ALALCVTLLLALPTDGEHLAKPRHVGFVAETARHLLRWEPGPNTPSDARYEVKHKVYGMNISWAAAPNCVMISEHSCDLTYYTLDPTLRYYAQVRAVAGNRTSPWQRSNSFSPQEASLRLSGQSLSVMGNTIHVELQLLLRAGNLTVSYDDIQKYARLYRVYIRRAHDNWTNQVVETTPEFNISNLFWDTEYCVSVEPYVASRHNRATRTDEQCVTTGQRDRSSELILSISTSSFISVMLLGLLGALLVCTYIKKPVRPPSVLKTFMKQGSLWVEQETLSPGSQDADPIQQLFLSQKEPQLDSSPDGSTCTAQASLEKGCRLPAWSEDQVCLLDPAPTGSRDSSCTSTDSGICLHTSELSCSSGPKPRGYKQQLPTGDDSGMGLESTCLHSSSSSGSRSTSPVEPRQPQGEELSLSPDISHQEVEFRGYLQQSKGTVELMQDPAQGMSSGSAGPLRDPGHTDVILDVEGSELAAVAKEYLKQSSPEHPHSHAQHLSPWEGVQNPSAWSLSGQLWPQEPTQLGYRDLLASKGVSELLKPPFEPSIFDTDLLGTWPTLSSLNSNDWLTLQINPLSLLNGDSKDSRL
ncbi:I10R1 protein, partial [Heliornis fulica]|nr:I10R1 protein [Heliornis fulica]